MAFPFNVRVYGVVIIDNKVLLSDEVRGEFSFTKFPGGGLEFGEGTIDCIHREFREETGAEVLSVEHLYTTDFFQRSAFNQNDQIISIYYLVEVADPELIEVTSRPFDFSEGNLVFRWKDVNDMTGDELTFPIDKVVLSKIKS